MLVLGLIINFFSSLETIGNKSTDLNHLTHNKEIGMILIESLLGHFERKQMYLYCNNHKLSKRSYDIIMWNI